MHLLERTGFGVRPEELASILPLTREQAVDRLIASLDAPLVVAPPAFTAETHPDYWADGWMSQPVMFWRINEITQLQTWWLQQMVLTPAPFVERLTLFWHNHFVSRFDNTHLTAPFLDQLLLFRQQGSQNLRSLLRQILVDPMMLAGLDNVYNNRRHPNENLARELLELFTLGIGNYSQEDVAQVAKLLAGHGVDRNHGWRYRFNADDAVPADKTVLGATVAGDLPPGRQLDRLVDILLQQPSAARLIAQKAYVEWISLEEDATEIKRLAEVLRQQDYAIRPFLRALLLGPAFWDERNRGALIKSPVDLIVGFARTFDLQLADYQILADYSSILGQELFMAPSVAGWRGGTQWLDSKTLVDRQRVIRRLWQAQGQQPEDRPGLYVRFASEHVGTPVHLRVLVDGEELDALQASLGVDTREEAGSNEAGFLKPMWELAWIPADRLPAHPHSVSIVREPDNPGANLFVNWIAWNGRRYSPKDATWQQPVGKPCPTDAPLGAFYCNLSLRFDLTSEQTTDDRAAPLNASLDYGSGCLPTRYLGGFVPRHARWQDEELEQVVARFKPIQPGAPPQDRRARLLAATLDPAYNLK